MKIPTTDTTPELPQAWQDALNEFYNKFLSNPTNTQKLNMLIHEVGDYCVSYMGMSHDTPEQYEEMKLRVMELDYLEHVVGLYRPKCY